MYNTYLINMVILNIGYQCFIFENSSIAQIKKLIVSSTMAKLENKLI